MSLCTTNLPVGKSSSTQDRQVELAQRLMKFIIDRCSTPLSVAEICRGCGVSATAANTAFKAYWKVTPINFLRILRLHGANRDLMKAKRIGGSVTDVALDWGFIHFGRFSSYYKREFGELPSVTLQKSQSQSHLYVDSSPVTAQALGKRLSERFGI